MHVRFLHYVFIAETFSGFNTCSFSSFYLCVTYLFPINSGEVICQSNRWHHSFHYHAYTRLYCCTLFTYRNNSIRSTVVVQDFLYYPHYHVLISLITQPMFHVKHARATFINPCLSLYNGRLSSRLYSHIISLITLLDLGY